MPPLRHDFFSDVSSANENEDKRVKTAGPSSGIDCDGGIGSGSDKAVAIAAAV